MTSLSDNLFNETTYLSPFTTRYGSTEMRTIWSEKNKRLLWRSLWLALAKEEKKAGIVSEEEYADLLAHKDTINIPRAKAIEKDIYHELMAEITVFREQCTIGGGKIHLGATSTDILDNATILQIKASIELIRQSLIELIELFAEKIETYKSLVCMGYTHLQPAEPTTLGYRLSFYAQDLFMDLQFLEKIEKFIQAKGIKGAVGTSASYAILLEETDLNPLQFEKNIMDELELDAIIISNQTYPRKIDWFSITILANIAQSLHKFAFDYRLMQSPGFGEWEEKRTKSRIGSSAMPFKKNPDKAEKVCSLARYISSLLNVAWSNPANSLLERTLDDSANQRLFVPESFLALDECLSVSKNLIKDLIIEEEVIKKNLKKYGIFSVAEPLMMALVKKGADRQLVHEILKQHAMAAWDETKKDNTNPFISLILHDKRLTKILLPEEMKQYFNLSSYTGVAKERTQQFLELLDASRKNKDK